MSGELVRTPEPGVMGEVERLILFSDAVTARPAAISPVALGLTVPIALVDATLAAFAWTLLLPALLLAVRV